LIQQSPCLGRLPSVAVASLAASDESKLPLCYPLRSSSQSLFFCLCLRCYLPLSLATKVSDSPSGSSGHTAFGGLFLTCPVRAAVRRLFPHSLSFFWQFVSWFLLDSSSVRVMSLLFRSFVIWLVSGMMCFLSCSMFKAIRTCWQVNGWHHIWSLFLLHLMSEFLLHDQLVVA
jgi:hypothetical protein